MVELQLDIWNKGKYPKTKFDNNDKLSCKWDTFLGTEKQNIDMKIIMMKLSSK